MIKAILADIDGTLIEGGNLQTVHPILKETIRKVRNYGILFSLASGRPFFEQEAFHRLLIEPTEGGKVNPLLDVYRAGEGIVYEGSCVRLLGYDEVYQLGGLTREQLREINQFAEEQGLFTEMVPQANNDRYETTTGRVTPTFRSEGRTNTELLERTYHRVKPILEERFPFVEVVMSADAIDINAKGVTKGPPTRKYAEITGIPLEQIAAMGDSGNDMPMLDVVGQAGGLAIYVGRRAEQEEIVRQYAHHFVPNQRGVLGTVEALEYVIQCNESGNYGKN